MATTYVVLQEDESGPHWVQFDTDREPVTAPNTEAACRQVAERLTDEELGNGPLRAVPHRNWTSGRHFLKAETTRRIRST